MAYYFLLDQMRSLLFSSPASFQPALININLSNNYSFSSVYEDMVAKQTPLPVDLDEDDYLLLLLGIISDVISCHRSLGVTTPRRPATENDSEYMSSSNGNKYNNPTLVLSVEGEYARTLQGFKTALSLLESDYMSKYNRPAPSKADPRLDLLFQFGRMISEGDLSFLILPQSTGLAPSSNFQAPADLSSIQIPPITGAMVSHAWSIWETHDSKVCEYTDNTVELSSLWSSICLFYAGLAIWANIHQAMSRLPKDSKDSPRHSINSIGLFESALREGSSPLSRTFAGILRSLRLRG